MEVSFDKQIRLDLIRIDGGTQQRPVEDEIVTKYVALMQDKIEFPAIELIFDGAEYWLWDGFHRYHCARRQNQTVITANVAKGTLRDAIWLSFSANKDHGLPRQTGVAKQIIEQILTDKSWSRKSLTAIAKHVGITRQYVTQVKDALSAHNASSLSEKDKENGVSESEMAQGASTCTLSRDKEIEVQTKDGIPYTQRSQAKEHKAKEPMKDAVGHVIPEPLREVYKYRSVINSLITDLEKIKHLVENAAAERNPVFTMLNTTAFQAHCENLRRTLKSARPYALCCYCGGDAKDCKACQGFGFLNEHTYRAAPKELQK